MAKELLKRLTTMFGTPKTEDPGAFLSEYIRAMAPYGTDVLDLAGDRLLKSHKFRTWPSIAECIDAASKAAEELHGRKKELDKQRRENKTQIVDGILRNANDMTQRACQEGWIVGLHDFVRDRNRLPNTDERNNLRMDADFVAQASTGDQNLGNFHGPLLELSRSIMARREKLIQEFAQ